MGTVRAEPTSTEEMTLRKKSPRREEEKEEPGKVQGNRREFSKRSMWSVNSNAIER